MENTIQNIENTTNEVVVKELWQKSKELAEKFKQQCNDLAVVITEDFITSVRRAHELHEIDFSDDDQVRRVQLLYALKRVDRRRVRRAVASELGQEQCFTWQGDNYQDETILNINKLLDKDIYNDNVNVVLGSYHWCLRETSTFTETLASYFDTDYEAIKLFLLDVSPENNIYMLWEELWDRNSLTTKKIAKTIFALLTHEIKPYQPKEDFEHLVDTSEQYYKPNRTDTEDDD